MTDLTEIRKNNNTTDSQSPCPTGNDNTLNLATTFKINTWVKETKEKIKKKKKEASSKCKYVNNFKKLLNYIITEFVK